LDPKCKSYEIIEKAEKKKKKRKKKNIKGPRGTILARLEFRPAA
jgi:hypothetical protein